MENPENKIQFKIGSREESLENHQAKTRDSIDDELA